MFQKAENKIYMTKNSERSNCTYRSVNYQGPLSYSIKKKLRRHNIHISFKTQQNLKNLLNNSKDKIDKLQHSGVYRMECDTCSASYIGETGRSINIRIDEHLKNKNSYFYKHTR